MYTNNVYLLYVNTYRQEFIIVELIVLIHVFVIIAISYLHDIQYFTIIYIRIYLTGSFLIQYMRVRYSLYYYKLLLSCISIMYNHNHVYLYQVQSCIPIIYNHYDYNYYNCTLSHTSHNIYRPLQV